MARAPRQPSPLATLLLLGLFATLAYRVRMSAFIGPASPPAARKATTAMQVDMFDGIRLPNLGFGEEKDGQVTQNRYSAREASDESRVVEVDLPLGVSFEEKEEGNVYIKEVDPASDAYRQGVRPGAQLVMVSATFGDEMWTARGVGLTQLSTVIRSRFGPTIKLALEKEDKSLLDAFFQSFAPKPQSSDVTEAKQKSMQDEFEKAEKDLEEKNMWNPFR